MKRSLEVSLPNNSKPLLNEPTLKRKRTFDFAAHPKRKIAFTFYYYGWLYDGLVIQANTQNTVEYHLREALIKTKLIECWEDCDFTRCGRTDKGVSAFKQVAACMVRSSDKSGEGVFWEPTLSEETVSDYKSSEELPFLKMLNGVLPQSIRVMCWAPVDRSFTARHACTQRTYKYSFPRADLDVDAMKQACSYLIGTHDYRNFCQVDMNESRVTMSYVREIFDVRLDDVPSASSSATAFSLLELTVKGSGFLWHMIRYIVTVLHEVGCRNEKPEIVVDMLDVVKMPCRPQYSLAAETPLCLFDCSFDRNDLKWNYDELVSQKNYWSLQKEWADMITKCRILENMMSSVATHSDSSETTAFRGLIEFTQARPLPQKHIPFSQRPKCDSLEEKLRKLAKKKELMKVNTK